MEDMLLRQYGFSLFHATMAFHILVRNYDYLWAFVLSITPKYSAKHVFSIMVPSASLMMVLGVLQMTLHLLCLALMLVALTPPRLASTMR